MRFLAWTLSQCDWCLHRKRSEHRRAERSLDKGTERMVVWKPRSEVLREASPRELDLGLLAQETEFLRGIRFLLCKPLILCYNCPDTLNQTIVHVPFLLLLFLFFRIWEDNTSLCPCIGVSLTSSDQSTEKNRNKLYCWAETFKGNCNFLPHLSSSLPWDHQDHMLQEVELQGGRASAILVSWETVWNKHSANLLWT